MSTLILIEFLNCILKSNNAPAYKLNPDSNLKPDLKVPPSRREAERSLAQTASNMETHTRTHTHTQTTPLPPHRHYTPKRPPNSSVFFTQHWPPPSSSSSLPGWHVKTVIFRHTSPAVCWLFPWCRGDSERASGEQGAGLASSPASLRLLMQQQPAWPPG